DTPFMPLRSMTMPAHSARPAQWWPPPRTDSGRPKSRDRDGQLDVFGRPAVDDGARQGAHRLRPDRGRAGIAVPTRQRDTARQLSFKPTERSFDLSRHWLYLRV